MSINEPSMSPKIHELTPKSLMHQDVKAQGDIKYKIEIKLDNNTQVFIWSKDNKLPDPHQLSKITQIAQNLNAAGLKGQQTTLHFLYESGKKFELLDVVALKNTTVNKYRDQTGDIIKFITKSNISIFKESYQKAIDQTEKPPTKQGKSIKVDSQKYEALKSQRKPAQKAPLPPSDELDFPKMPTRPPPKLPSRSDFPEKPTRPVPKLPPLSEKEVKLEKLLSEVLDPQDIKQNLPATLSHLCNKYISKEDLGKESLLYGSLNKAKMKIAQRLAIYLKAGIDIKEQSPSLAKRQESTGYEISILKGIEKAFKNNVLSQTSETTVTDLKEHNLKVIVSRKNVIIEEKKFGEGAFKVATGASDYFAMKGPEQRMAYVTLKPKDQITNPVKDHISMSKNIETNKQDEDENPFSASGTFVSNDSGTFVSNDSGTFVSNDSGTFVSNNSGTFVSNNSGTVQTGTFVNSGTNPNIASIKTTSGDQAPSYMQAFILDDIPLKNLPFEQLTLEQMTTRLEELKNELEEIKQDQSNQIPLLKEQISGLESYIKVREKENDLVKTFREMSDEEEFAHEINLTQKFRGEGVISVHSVVDINSKNKVMIQESAGYRLENGKIAIDLEKMGKMHKTNQLTKQESVKMMEMVQQAFTGVQRLHNMGYIHRDLKEENILITKDGKGALADFGTVVGTKNDPLKAKYSGTPRYSAPETFKYDNKEQWNLIDEKSDVWSCGMIIQNLFVEGGLEVHPAVNGMQALHLKEINQNLDLPKNKDKYEKGYPEPENPQSFEHLVWEATRIDSAKRPTMKEFCEKLEKIINLEKNK